jgi:L-alanine-DL-glutamate epimerase-like enolase superfamily enzyme
MHITDVKIDVEAGLLRLCTDGPHQGHAIGINAREAQAIDTVYQPLIVGASVWERERLWLALKEAGRRAHLSPSTWGLVDIALWDLLGKTQDLPVFRVAGGFRDRVPAYRLGSAIQSDEITAQARAAKDEGLWGFAFDIDGQDDPAALARRLRHEVGDSFRLLCNGGRAQSLEQALTLGRVLDEINAHWYEEPLASDNLVALKDLSDALDLPVVAGAFIGAELTTATQALSTRAVDRLRFEIPTAGGITDALKLLRGAEAMGMNCEIGWARRSGPHAAAQVLGAARNAEFLAVDGDGPLEIKNGEALLPLEPGLGLSLSDS